MLNIGAGASLSSEIIGKKDDDIEMKDLRDRASDYFNNRDSKNKVQETQSLIKQQVDSDRDSNLQSEFNK